MGALVSLLKILLGGLLIVFGGIGLFLYAVVSLAPDPIPEPPKKVQATTATVAKKQPKAVVVVKKDTAPAAETDYDDEMCRLVNEEYACVDTHN